MEHGGAGAAWVGVGSTVLAPLLGQAGGHLGGGRAARDGPGGGRRAGGSLRRARDPDVLVPRPVVGDGRAVGLLGQFLHLP